MVFRLTIPYSLRLSTGFLVLHYNKKWGYALLVLAAVIGLSRIIAGVHHLLDIVGSFVFAGSGMAVAYYFGKRVLRAQNGKAYPILILSAYAHAFPLARHPSPSAWATHRS